MLHNGRLWALLAFCNATYITEVQSVGYNEAPLEKLAYAFDLHFSQGGQKVDVPSYVENKYNKLLKRRGG